MPVFAIGVLASRKILAALLDCKSGGAGKDALPQCGEAGFYL